MDHEIDGSMGNVGGASDGMPGSEAAQAADAITLLAEALSELVDYGTAWANKAGAVTIPASARDELGLNSPDHWRVFGSPALGVALVIGPRRSPRESLEFLLRASG
jgi:hypothetical protein